MVFSCFAVYILANNTRVIPYFYRREWPPTATIHDSKYGTTRALFASTYTAKQMKTMYYSLTIWYHKLCINTVIFLYPIRYHLSPLIPGVHIYVL